MATSRNGVEPPAQERRYTGDTSEYNSRWIARGRRGLVVAGLVSNHRWKFAATASELPNQGRLEIWLSAVESFELPDIKYDQEACGGAPDSSSKDFCLRWIQDQTVYRENLQRQATRLWRIAPAVAEEAYALPAYDAFTETQRKALRSQVLPDCRSVSPALLLMVR